MPVLLTSGATDGDSTTFTTAPITTHAGKFTALWVSSQRVSAPADLVVPTVTGGGFTWGMEQPLYQRVLTWANTHQLMLFTGTGTPGTGPLTFTFSAAQRVCAWAVLEFDTATEVFSPPVGYDGTAIRSWATNVVDAQHGVTMTLPPPLDPTSWVMSASISNVPGGSDIVPGAGYTEVADLGAFALHISRMNVMYRPNAGNNTPTHTDTTAVADNYWAGIAVELLGFDYEVPVTPPPTPLPDPPPSGSGNIHWTKVASYPPMFGGCGPQGIVCLGGGNMVATVEELDDLGGVTRVFLSSNNGLTWHEQLPAFITTHATTNSAVRNLGPYTFLMGLLEFNNEPWESQFSMVTLGTLAGSVVGFQSRVTAAAYAALNPTPASDWRFDDFIVIPGGKVFATAHILTVDNTEATQKHFLVSTDGGLTFDNATNTGVLTPNGSNSRRSGIWAGGNNVLIFQENSTPLRKIARSTDGGTTWTAVTVAPTVNGGFIHGHYRASINRAWLAGYMSGSPPQPRVYYSDDGGATWTQSTITGLTTAVHIATDVIAIDDTHVVAGFSHNTNEPFLVMSTDGGVTFNDAGSYAPGWPVGGGSVTQLAVADDGAVLAMFGNESAFAYEIWRGVVTGLTAAGPCAGLVIVPTASIVTTILASEAPPPPPPPPPPPNGTGTVVDFRIDIPSQWAQESGMMPITIYARTQGGAIAQSYVGTVTLDIANPGAGSVSQLFASGVGGLPVPLTGTVTTAFTQGVWVGGIILATSSLATTQLTLRATDGSLTGSAPILWTIGGPPPPPPPPPGNGGDAFGFFKGNARYDTAPSEAFSGFNPGIAGWNPTYGPWPFTIGSMVNDGEAYLEFNGTARFFTQAETGDSHYNHLLQLYDINMNPLAGNIGTFSGGGFQGFASISIDNLTTTDARFFQVGCENTGGTHQAGFTRTFYWGPPPGPTIG